LKSVAGISLLDEAMKEEGKNYTGKTDGFSDRCGEIIIKCSSKILPKTFSKSRLTRRKFFFNLRRKNKPFSEE
jgi:hypothetical protein